MARRSKERETAVLFRTSVENRDLLRARARASGFTSLQEWMEAMLLGDATPKHVPKHQEELPLSKAS